MRREISFLKTHPEECRAMRANKPHSGTVAFVVEGDVMKVLGFR